LAAGKALSRWRWIVARSKAGHRGGGGRRGCSCESALIFSGSPSRQTIKASLFGFFCTLWLFGSADASVRIGSYPSMLLSALAIGLVWASLVVAWSAQQHFPD
jgi:hypothetical protein